MLKLVIFFIFLSAPKILHSLIVAVHEHELRPDVDNEVYEQEMKDALVLLQRMIPGLLTAFHIKGIKGKRTNKYAVIWLFANQQVLEDNFGTVDNPKMPDAWRIYENNTLAKFLTQDPNAINFTDYTVLSFID